MPVLSTYQISGELSPDDCVKIAEGHYLSKYDTVPDTYNEVYKYLVTLQQLHEAIIDAVDVKLICPHAINDDVYNNILMTLPPLSIWVYRCFMFGEYKEPCTEFDDNTYSRFDRTFYGKIAPEELSTFKKHLTKNRPDVAKFLAKNETFYLWRSDKVPMRTVVFDDISILPDYGHSKCNPILSCGLPFYLTKG